MPWLVVKFNESNEVEVVPSSWFNRNSNKCLYPSFSKTKLGKAIKQQFAPPNLPNEEWKEYKGELMSQKDYNNFNIANAKASKACLTSDVSDLEEFPQKRIPKKKSYDDEVYSSNDDDSGETPTLLNFPKHPFNKQGNQRTNSKNSKQDVDIQSINSENSKEDEGTQSTSSKQNSKGDEGTHHSISSKNSEEYEGTPTFENEVIRYLIYNKKLLDSLGKQIENLTVLVTQNARPYSLEREKNSSESILQTLPLQTIEAFENLQEKLKDEASQSLITALSRIGGTNYKECTRRIMSKIMSNDLAKLFTLHGHRENKKPFSSTTVFPLIVEALQAFDPKVTQKDIELQIGIWLTKAGERITKEQSKNKDP